MTTAFCLQDSDDFKDSDANMLDRETVDPISNIAHSSFETQFTRSSSDPSSPEEAVENTPAVGAEAHPDGLYDPKGYYKNGMTFSLTLLKI